MKPKRNGSRDRVVKAEKDPRGFAPGVTIDEFLIHVVTKAKGLDCDCPQCERERKAS